MTASIDSARPSHRGTPPGRRALHLYCGLDAAQPGTKEKMAWGVGINALKRLDSDKEIQENSSLFL
jgi:hypothetical protein